jgi:hypothetical protein
MHYSLLFSGSKVSIIGSYLAVYSFKWIFYDYFILKILPILVLYRDT